MSNKPCWESLKVVQLFEDSYVGNSFWEFLRMGVPKRGTPMWGASGKWCGDWNVANLLENITFLVGEVDNCCHVGMILVAGDVNKSEV